MIHNNKAVAYIFSIFAMSSAIISFYLNINLSIIISYTGINEYLSEFNIFTKNGTRTEQEAREIIDQVLNQAQKMKKPKPLPDFKYTEKSAEKLCGV